MTPAINTKFTFFFIRYNSYLIYDKNTKKY